MMNGIYGRGRDNARTPMQWDDSENAGFTTGTPWIKVNENYKTINAEVELNDPDSIFNYYKKLIKVRKENDVIVYGKYELLLEEDENIYSYTRTLNDKKLLVLCNFSKDKQNINISDEINYKSKELLISNYNEFEENVNSINLRPYEARVYLLSL